MFRASVCRPSLAAWLLAGISFSSSALAQEPGAVEEKLPLKKVVLFSSGVGFFEHQSMIDGDTQVDLKFNVDDINDLLKSMVLEDGGGGGISTVNYGSKDPITKTLATFSIDLTSNPTMGDLLSQIRGEEVEIDAPNVVRGTIIGVETRTEKVKADETIQVQYLNLLTNDGLRSVPLIGVGRIKLANAALDAELRQALAVLALGHDTDKKTVSLNFVGDGTRPVRVGYIQETPIWKTSYRLVLDDKAPPFLQGWAIVENTTEADWDGVNLTLVSGRPISFMMDLYQPLYVPRPLVEPELFASLRPQTYGQDLAERDAEFAARAMSEAETAGLAAGEPLADQDRALGWAMRRAGAGGVPGPAGGFGMAGEAYDKAFAGQFDPSQGAQSLAQAGDVGELFQYAISTPVTLPRQQSAMLQIANGPVEGEKLAIYNPNVHSKHPLNGLLLKNTTELHLMQGPITVFDDGAYAGDAQIQDLPPGSERLVSYALDLDTEVAPETKGVPEQLVSVKIVKGVLESTNKYTRVQIYKIKNSGDASKKVLVEYPFDSAWTLKAPSEPTEKTRDLYRFAVQAEPGKAAELKIEEEQVISQGVALVNLDDNMIQFYLRAKVVGEKVKEALREVVKRKLELADLAGRKARLEQEIVAIDQEQNRIRQNMAQLDRNNDLYTRYVKKLGEQEERIETLRGQIAELTDQEVSKRTALDEYLVSLSLE